SRPGMEAARWAESAARGAAARARAMKREAKRFMRRLRLVIRELVLAEASQAERGCRARERPASLRLPGTGRRISASRRPAPATSDMTMNAFRHSAITALALALTAACFPAAASRAQTTPADLVLRNGKIVTMDANNRQGQAIAITGDKVTAVGTDAAIQRYVGPKTKVIDLHGHLAIPGFNESHGHFTGLGSSLTQLKLMGVPSWQDIAAMVAAAAKTAKPGAWIQGRGWHQEKWNRSPGRVVKGFQTNDLITAAAPNSPVVLGHASGHALIANAKALELAGVTAATPSPPGGEIIKDESGKPTGVFVDGAQALIRRALSKSLAQRSPAEAKADFVNEVHLAVQNALENGVTEFQDMGESFDTIDGIKRLVDAGDMPLRLYILVSQGEVRPDNVNALVAHRMIDYGNGHLTVRAIGEITADGALGSRSAWMLKPYD